METIALDRIYKVEVEPIEGQSLEDVVAEYNQDPDVEYAELNYIVSINLVPNDPLFPLQWPLNNTGQMYPESGRYNHPPGTPDADIDAPEAWDVSTGLTEVVIAVVDTGVYYNHRDLQNNRWINQAEYNGTTGIDDDDNGYVDDIYGYDFFNDDSDPLDDNNHGTHCAGTIAADANNNLDITGVCWKGRIMALKFIDRYGYGSVGDAVTAFYYAVENGADVISNSWGGGENSSVLQDAVNYAHSRGVIVVAAAGNSNSSVPIYPAACDNVISVAATNSNDQKAPFSSYGDWVDIAAPGVDILSLRPSQGSSGGGYDGYTSIASGTSMACPFVAGACASLISANPTLTKEEILDMLMRSGDPIEDGICLSDKRLNLFNLLSEAQPSKGRIALDKKI
jgi:subtilisin family serine protease